MGKNLMFQEEERALAPALKTSFLNSFFFYTGRKGEGVHPHATNDSLRTAEIWTCPNSDCAALNNVYFQINTRKKDGLDRPYLKINTPQASITWSFTAQ